LSDDLDEEKRKQVFAPSEILADNGISLSDKLFVTIEKIENKHIPLLYVNLKNEKKFKSWARQHQLVFSSNSEMAVIALWSNFEHQANNLNKAKSKNSIITLLQDIIKNKQKTPFKVQFMDNNIAQIHFPKQNLRVNVFWNKHQNSLVVNGEIPAMLTPHQRFLIEDSNSYYLALPVRECLEWLPQHLLSNQFSFFKEIDFFELKYYGMEIELENFRVHPQAQLVLQMKDSLKIPLHQWLEKSGQIQITSDTSLIIAQNFPFQYRIDSSRIYLYYNKLDVNERVSSIVAKSAGSLKALFNFNGNDWVKLWLSGLPKIQETKNIVENIDFQNIKISSLQKKQRIEATITFSKSLNVPFEMIYLLRVFQSH
jgi:hypothetical protein